MTNTVDIITRTKDRQIFLHRALNSILSQTYCDFTWNIVNDGGQKDKVNSIANIASSKGISVAAYHNEISQGRWVAANIGLNMSSGKYIIIHDDDDRWEPEFLRKTVAFLESQPEGSNIKGVVTRSVKVTESIKNNSIKEIRQKPYDKDLIAITLFQMAHLRLVPPPISFLYDREVLQKLNSYNDKLPVLGDWEFYLRFLSYYDIGVIPEYLAHYHWRETTKKESYSNSVVAEIDIHKQYRAIILNDFLRQDLRNGSLGLGFLINLCQDFEEINIKVNAWYKLSSILKRLLGRR